MERKTKRAKEKAKIGQGAGEGSKGAIGDSSKEEIGESKEEANSHTVASFALGPAKDLNTKG